MAHINTTGNGDIDEATAEIALALRDAHPTWNAQACYSRAERLRDAIMAGTRQLDIDRAVAEYEDGGGLDGRSPRAMRTR